MIAVSWGFEQDFHVLYSVEFGVDKMRELFWGWLGQSGLMRSIGNLWGFRIHF